MYLSEPMYGPHVLVCVRVRDAFKKKKKKKKKESGALTTELSRRILSVLKYKVHVRP